MLPATHVMRPSGRAGLAWRAGQEFLDPRKGLLITLHHLFPIFWSHVQSL